MCAEVPPYCCSADCPCADADLRCVATFDDDGGEVLGVCKPASSGGECWIYTDCAQDEFCLGVSICPCEMDCDFEGSGTCAPSSGACCEGAPDTCPDGYACLALDGTDTCHGILNAPQCWTADDCVLGNCVGAIVCACDVDCLSSPGICQTWE